MLRLFSAKRASVSTNRRESSGSPAFPILLICSAALLSACVTNHPRQSAFATKSSESFSSASAFVGAERSFRYRVQAGDVLRIEFVKKMDFNRDLSVQPDGWISAPYIEPMKVAGLTLPELQSKLESAYGEVLRFNQLQVDLLQTQPQYIYVGGEVVSTGRQVFNGTTTVQQAILSAGGATKRSALKKVFVVRDTGEETPSYIVFDFSSKEAEGYRDIYLQPSDIVIVPKSNVSKVSHFLDLYIDEILPFSRSINATYYFDETDRDGPPN